MVYLNEFLQISYTLDIYFHHIFHNQCSSDNASIFWNFEKTVLTVLGIQCQTNLNEQKWCLLQGNSFCKVLENWTFEWIWRHIAISRKWFPFDVHLVLITERKHHCSSFACKHVLIYITSSKKIKIKSEFETHSTNGTKTGQMKREQFYFISET